MKMDEDKQYQIFTLDDKTEDYFILSKLFRKEKDLKCAEKNSKQE